MSCGKEVDQLVGGVESRVRSLSEGVLQEKDLEILDVEFSRGTLRIILDSPDLLDLDRVAAASSLISKLVDESPDFEDLGSFTLEVSSPGVERTLRTEDHFRRFTGAKVSIKTKPNVKAPRRFRGVVDQVRDGVLVVSLDESRFEGQRELVIDIEDIERAHTVFEWGSQGAPKSKPKSRTTGSKKSNSANNEIAKD